MKLPRLGERAHRIVGAALGLTLGAGIIALLPDVPIADFAPVGFLLCAVMGACLFVAWWGADNRIDDHEQRLVMLERRGTAVGEPEAVEPTEEAATDEIPAVRPVPTRPDRTEPMEFGDHIDVDLRAHNVREAIAATQAADWVEAELQKTRARNAERNAARPVAEEAAK